MAGGGPGRLDRALHARDLAPPAVQLGRARQRHGRRAVLASRSTTPAPTSSINGHDHDYERFAPQDPNAHEDRVRGIREFVVGTGGAALRTFPTTAANSELRAAVAHGVIRLVLHPASYEWSFIPTTGDVTDSGSGALPLRYRGRP